MCAGRPAAVTSEGMIAAAPHLPVSGASSSGAILHRVRTAARSTLHVSHAAAVLVSGLGVACRPTADPDLRR
jgi:hypothetical protein